MKSSSKDNKKCKTLLKELYIEKEQLSNEIKAEKDVDKFIQLTKDYSNLCYRIEVEEQFLLPAKKKRIAPKTFSREKKIPTKRCG